MMHVNSRDRSGRYELVEPLGHDALTRVFAARRAGAPRGQLARLELLHPVLARDDNLRARFLDQAAAMLSLSHPGLPRVWEVLTESDACGLALELVPGRSLAEVLQRTGRARCPVDLHLYLLRQVLGALAHAHGQVASSGSRAGFVHGDVSPGRVHMGYAGEVQLLGGGLAACRHALAMTQARPIVDVRYAAPEVLLGEAAGPSADIFSLGVMLWEALTRQARSPDIALGSVIRRRTLGQETDLEDAWPEAPDPLLRLCARALALAPRDRYSSAAEMAADLDAYLDRAGEPRAIVRARVSGWLSTLYEEGRDARARGSEPPWRPEGAQPAPEPERLGAEAAPQPGPVPAAVAGGHPPRSSVLPEPSHAASETGNHRAFSSTWNGSPAGGRPAWPGASAALPVLTVAAGAIAAVWLVLGHGAPRERNIDLAAGAAAALLPAPPAREAAADRTTARAHRGALDAGVRHGSSAAASTLPPAFFAGRFPSNRSDTSAPLAADELPQVDDVRDSLQAAIVRAARAQRRAHKARPSKPSGSASAAVAPAPNPTPEMGVLDPYAAGAARR